MSEKKILIVEDDEISQQYLTRFLTDAGYAVVRCGDGPTAVSLAATQKPDLILLDLGLPSPNPKTCPSFDGFRVLDWLPRVLKPKKIPVIVLSAQDAGQAKETALKAGATAFLQKPADPAKLLAAIKIALNDV
jgi:DNA-binding response OmpR family regulator